MTNEKEYQAIVIFFDETNKPPLTIFNVKDIEEGLFGRYRIVFTNGGFTEIDTNVVLRISLVPHK